VVIKALPAEIILKKRVIRSKIVRGRWMNDNDLEALFRLIKRQKWENLFKRRELMHVTACKEFYANLTVSISKKKEVARSCVRGVRIELDGTILAGILGVPGNNGICEYIKDIWEESTYYKPLEITKKFANDDLITVARRVKSTEMKPFQRFLHFIVMKNVASRFGKRDTISFMDLTYMDHLLTRRLVNLPRVMLRHMAYVISVENHELPYGDWLTMVFEAYNVPVIDKQGAKPKSYDYFKETFLTMCQLRRMNGVWWCGTGEGRRRDDDEAPTENVGNVEVNEGEEVQQDFDWEQVEEEAEIHEESGSDHKFYDAEVEVEESTDMDVQVPDVAASAHRVLETPAPSSVQQKEKTAAGVDPSSPTGNILDSDFLKIQAEFDRARAERLQVKLDRARVENARLQALLQQAPPQPKP
ncbi:hypothetical protein Dimus_018115, partial [Dionaea muscipula]